MVLKIQDVVKVYDDGHKALSGVNLEIGRGIFGLLGPNGAGKSSLMRTIATLQQADSGNIFYEDTSIFDHPEFLLQRLGYLPQEFGVYPRSSAVDLMNYLATLKGIPASKERKKYIDELLELVNLTDHKKRSVASYSGGMKQRFGIAQALLGDPSLIIVDEPTAGLDPEERIRFLNIISELGKSKTIILSTHIVEDVANLCESFCILKKGVIVAEDSPETALAQIEDKIYLCPSDQLSLEASHLILSEKFISGRKFYTLYSEESLESPYIRKEAGLEDYYLFKMKSK